MNIYSYKNRGFTLVEIIVSLGVFSVVAVVALGAMVRIISANKKAQTLQSAMTNLNYALESMSRELRVGTRYYCVADAEALIPLRLSVDTDKCPSGASSSGGVLLAFNSSKVDISVTPPCPLVFAYRIRSDGSQYFLEKAQQKICSTPIVEEDFYSLTDPNLIITDYRVQVSDDPYPLASIKLGGYAGIREKEKTYFDVQTAISPRLPL